MQGGSEIVAVQRCFIHSSFEGGRSEGVDGKGNVEEVSDAYVESHTILPEF